MTGIPTKQSLVFLHFKSDKWPYLHRIDR